MSSLDVWDLDDIAEAVYRALLRNPQLDPAGLARHLDLSAEVTDHAIADLLRVGLVSAPPGSSAGSLVLASPATTLAALVHVEIAELEERRTRLDVVRASLSGFAADHMVGQSRSWSSVPFELLSPEESFVAVEDIYRGTSGQVLSCHPVVDVDVDAPSYVDLMDRQLAAGRSMRGVYPADVLDDPDRLAYVVRWSDAGEQVRLMAQTPPSITVWGTEVALISSSLGGGPDGSLVVRAPALVALAATVVGTYWDRARPLPSHPARRGAQTTAPDAVDERRQLAELLALGMKDERIARHLGLSLRTVRRRVADMMDVLGATTRFQAGMEAARRGLL